MNQMPPMAQLMREAQDAADEIFKQEQAERVEKSDDIITEFKCHPCSRNKARKALDALRFELSAEDRAALTDMRLVDDGRIPMNRLVAVDPTGAPTMMIHLKTGEAVPFLDFNYDWEDTSASSDQHEPETTI